MSHQQEWIQSKFLDTPGILSYSCTVSCFDLPVVSVNCLLNCSELVAPCGKVRSALEANVSEFYNLCYLLVIARMSTQDAHCSVILTTHSMEEAEALCTRIGISK
jgi:hypothetical protein